MERNKTRHYESTHTLKDEIDGRERLEAANFDLKLRVHHLEDALKRFTHTDSLGVEVEEITSENTNLKLQVHQQKLELQEKSNAAREKLEKVTADREAAQKENANAKREAAAADFEASTSAHAAEQAEGQFKADMKQVEADLEDLRKYSYAVDVVSRIAERREEDRRSASA